MGKFGWGYKKTSKSGSKVKLGEGHKVDWDETAKQGELVQKSGYSGMLGGNIPIGVPFEVELADGKVRKYIVQRWRPNRRRLRRRPRGQGQAGAKVLNRLKELEDKLMLVAAAK